MFSPSRDPPSVTLSVQCDREQCCFFLIKIVLERKMCTYMHVPSQTRGDSYLGHSGIMGSTPDGTACHVYEQVEFVQ